MTLFICTFQANMIGSTLHGETHVSNLLNEVSEFPKTIILPIIKEVNALK